MKKIFALSLCLVMALTAFAGCGANSASTSTAPESTASTSETTSATTEGSTLNLFTWEGMFPPEVLDAFTSETGIKVNYGSFDTDETMLSKLQTANGGDYDLIIADDYIIETAIAEGLVQEIDTTKVSNIGNVNPLYKGQFYDPTDAYTVPYGAGVMTIVYNPDVVDVEINGYADLWDADLADNLAIISNYRVINGMALKIAGESYNVTDVATIEAAGAKLLELAPNVRLIKDDNVQDDLVSGEVGAAVMYTSQVTMACLANPDLTVVYPEEGIGFGIMAQFIPVNAPNADAAHAFIDYLLRPEVAKQCFEWLGYYCTTEAADDLIDPAYQSFLTLPDDFDGTMEMIQNIPAEADEAHVKAWTEFKTACG